MKAYPTSTRNLTVFTSFACQAGDGDTYRRLRPRANIHLDDVWSHSHSVELCDDLYFKPI